MPPRDPDELGTSVMIVDTDVALEDIVRGVEDFWGPRIQEGLLEPVYVDAEGRESFAKPASRPDIRPFIDAYDIAVGRAPRRIWSMQRSPVSTMPPRWMPRSSNRMRSPSAEVKRRSLASSRASAG